MVVTLEFADNWYSHGDKRFQRPDPPQVQTSNKNFKPFFYLSILVLAYNIFLKINLNNLKNKLS